MKIICAWCKALMQDGPEYPISHGMCPECVVVMTASCEHAERCKSCHRIEGHDDGCMNDRPWAV